MKLYRVLGQEGRVTIPWDMRQIVGFRPRDIVSFCLVDERSVLVRKEELRTQEPPSRLYTRNAPLMDFLESLDETQRYAALVHLSVLWAESHDGRLPGGKI